MRASTARASSRACSATSVTTAFTCGLTASTRATIASRTSTALTSWLAMAPPRANPDICHSSVMGHSFPLCSVEGARELGQPGEQGCSPGCPLELILEVIYTRTARCCKGNLSGILAIKRLHLSACWLTLPGKVAIEPGWCAHPVLYYRVINIHAVDLVAVNWQPVPAILDPENGKTGFVGQALPHRIVHRLWMDAVCQPE